MKLSTISIILHGRDDEYVENFVEMLAFSINFLSKGIISQNIENRVEIVLVDWGSVVSFIPKIFNSIQLNKDINLSGYYVDNKTAKKHDGNNSYHVTKPLNFGMRQASGDFLLVISGNDIIPEQHLSQLLLLLDNRDSLLPETKRFMACYQDDICRTQ